MAEVFRRRGLVFVEPRGREVAAQAVWDAGGGFLVLFAWPHSSSGRNSVEESLLPEISHLVSLDHERGQLFVVPGRGAPLLLAHPENLFQFAGIEEIRRVGGYEHLSSPQCVASKFFGQLPEQIRVELIFRFLHAQQRPGGRIVEQGQVGNILRVPSDTYLARNGSSNAPS